MSAASFTHADGEFAMEYRLLGRSGLKVSAITMGTMTFGRSKSGAVGCPPG